MAASRPLLLLALATVAVGLFSPAPARVGFGSRTGGASMATPGKNGDEPPESTLFWDNLKSGQARDDGQREEQDQERPKIEMPKLELPDLSGASDMARVLLSRAGRELEKRGLVNPTDRPPPPPEVMGERPLERAPSSPSIPLEVLEQLKQLSALARPALDALRSKLPTEPGTLLRLALVLCVVTWVGSGLGGNTIPAGENKVVQAQVEQAKKGAQEMTRVKQLVELEESSIQRFISDIEAGRLQGGNLAAAARSASAQLRLSAALYEQASDAVTNYRKTASAGATALEEEITAALEAAEKGYAQALAREGKGGGGRRTNEVVGEFESATASLERSRALIQSQQTLKRVAAEGARAADTLGAAAAVHTRAAARIEADCEALDAAVARVAEVARRSVVDGKVVEGKVALRLLPDFLSARDSSTRADAKLADSLAAAKPALEQARLAAAAADIAAADAAGFVSAGGGWFAEPATALQVMRKSAFKALDSSSQADLAATQAAALNAGPDRWRPAKQSLVVADGAQVEAQLLLDRAGGLGREQMTAMKREMAASKGGKGGEAGKRAPPLPPLQPLPVRKSGYSSEVDVAAPTAEGAGKLFPAPPAPSFALAPVPPARQTAATAPDNNPLAIVAGTVAFAFGALAVGSFAVGGRRFLDSQANSSAGGKPGEGLFGLPIPGLAGPGRPFGLPFDMPRGASVKLADPSDEPPVRVRPQAAPAGPPPVVNGRARDSVADDFSARARAQAGGASGPARAAPASDGEAPFDEAAMRARARANADAAVRAAAAKRQARAAPGEAPGAGGGASRAKANADADAAVRAAAGRLAAEAAAGAAMGDAGQAAAVEMSPEVRAAAEAAAAAEAKAQALEARAAALDAQASALSDKLRAARNKPPNGSEPGRR